MDVAKLVSTWSKDTRKKIGCAMVSEDNALLDIGYNGFPPGFDDSPHLYDDAAYKANHIIHGEMNCIYNAAGKGIQLCGCTAYIYGLKPCSKCALALVRIKVKRIVFMNMYPDDPKWNEDWIIAQDTLNKAKIPYIELR